MCYFLGIKERNGPWYLMEHAIVRKSRDIETIGRSEWAYLTSIWRIL
jgi:hypothetical protein